MIVAIWAPALGLFGTTWLASDHAANGRNKLAPLWLAVDAVRDELLRVRTDLGA